MAGCSSYLIGQSQLRQVHDQLRAEEKGSVLSLELEYIIGFIEGTTLKVISWFLIGV